ncbi:unknown [Po-Circo-like virus 21]|uniref:Uncharacterized protein n=1 Tax=Po-Circo-like virus 21 TaxID=1105383 RepID=G8E3X3_9VIRU|nr:unknown [Po-Circo-like virus 21]AER30019.1 unknown [Po-Circo-like virus 21]
MSAIISLASSSLSLHFSSFVSLSFSFSTITWSSFVQYFMLSISDPIATSRCALPPSHLCITVMSFFVFSLKYPCICGVPSSRCSSSAITASTSGFNSRFLTASSSS